ncbi:MAG: hypothetical protein IKL85_02130, partial [Lentisphaeria bacterium]|nr:hypothetical protein [Lentisphaeria bacterium]
MTGLLWRFTRVYSIFFVLFNQYNMLTTDCQEKNNASLFFCLVAELYVTVSGAEGGDGNGLQRELDGLAADERRVRGP